MTSIISEGLADSFAKDVCPDLTPSWINALTTDQEAQQWDTLQEYLRLEDNMELHHRFFFGDAKNNTPPFTGYSIGYNITREFIKKRPNISYDKLVDINPWEVLEASNYNGKSLISK